MSFSLSSTSRMCLSGIGRLRCALEGDVERGAPIDFAFRPDAPAVTMDDAPHGGEPDARALELVLPVQTLEHAEQLARIAAVEAGAVSWMRTITSPSSPRHPPTSITA